MIKAIYTSPETGLPMRRHSGIAVIEKEGLEGDRYATGKGFYTGVKEWDAEVTLIQIEPFNELLSKHGIEIDPADLRRNLVVESISLDFLVGKRFQVGSEVVLETRKLWPPCSHIVKQSGRSEIMQYLAKSTGIGASVVTGGRIRIGDPVFPVGG